MSARLWYFLCAVILSIGALFMAHLAWTQPHPVSVGALMIVAVGAWLFWRELSLTSAGERVFDDMC